MSRLHINLKPTADIAQHFGAEDPGALDVPDETVEGGHGLVVLKKAERRLLRSASWGFPRLTREMREQGERPGRIGLVADLTNPLWDQLVADPRYRCLIALTHFANPDGDPGSKTRTWFSLIGEPVMAWAGFCRNLADYGPVYAGMTMTANSLVAPLNDRMPVILMPEDYERWLTGSIQDVIGFQFGAPISAERMVIERTEDAWRSGKLPATAQPQLALL
jgi:putative SOS response-associated peptidase YedK